MRPLTSSPVLSLLSQLALGVCTSGCGELADDITCGDRGCDFSRSEWKRVASLANLGTPELDRSNRYLGDEAAIAAGPVACTSTPTSRARPAGRTCSGESTSSAREAKGVRMKISCATCHDPARAGGDFTSTPGHVSEGAGWYDVNGQQTLNAAHYPLLYWNGRSDSLWAQAAAVMESPVSMNGNRIAIVRTVAAEVRRANTGPSSATPCRRWATALPAAGPPGRHGRLPARATRRSPSATPSTACRWATGAASTAPSATSPRPSPPTSGS